MNPPLRILLANSGRRWIGEVGHCALLYDALTAQGHHVLLACRRGSKLERYAADKGLNHIVLEFHSRPGLSDWRDLRALRARLREESIQLIHTHRGKDHWLGVALARWCRLPLVRTRHVVMPVSRHLLNRWLYSRGTQALICVSKAVEQGLGSLARRPPLSRIILSAVDSETFRPDRRSETWRKEMCQGSVPEQPLWIGLIGRIQRVKGQRPFIEAAGRVASEIPEAHFLIAGRKGPRHRKQFMRKAERLGFAGRLHVVGMRTDLPEIMASLDVGVVASLGSEGMSRVTLEYMASGVPVVGTEVGAIPELMLRDGEEPLGIVVPPGNVEALADAMLQLLRDPVRRRDLAGRGRQRVQSEHSLKGWADATVEVYRQVLAVGP